MKVQKVTLKEIALREVDGEWEKIFVNEKTYPAFLTNLSLKRGKDLGLIEHSSIGELLKLRSLGKLENFDEDAADDPEAIDALNEMDETKMSQIIYLAFIGANRQTDIDFDAFLDLFHYDFTDMMELYVKLISDLVTAGGNKFAAGLKQSTAGVKKK